MQGASLDPKVMSGDLPMTTESSWRDWAVVDRSVDPGAFVGYLDAMHGQDAIRAYKRHSFALLDLRPGHRVLDVGCGTGEDARALAEIVGAHGRVVGVDASAAMIEEARRRSEGPDLPVEFRVGDAHALDFADGAFDGARADRVHQHLEDPERALAELIRVTKSGGWVVVAEPDWGSLMVDAPDRETTEAVLAAIAGRVRHPWMGRRLYGLFQRAGLVEVSVVAGAAVLTNIAQADALFRFGEGIARARASGAVTGEAAAAWTRALEEAAAGGRFCCALVGFVAAGRHP
jgi:ubiquinone/menaquinone biosynthesis C-methylase UbiE